MRRVLKRVNPFKLDYLFRFLTTLATIAGAVLVTAGLLAFTASLFGIAPFAFVSQVQVPYVSLYTTPYLMMVDGPLTRYAVAQVLAVGEFGFAGAGAAIALGLWLLRRVVMWVCRGVLAAVIGVVRSPVATYRGIVRARNWLLAKVEYLQSESQRWVTLFRIARLPYSALRGLGFSPQMAATLLFAGSAVGTGVVVNETILEGRSFSRGDAGVYLAPGDSPVSYVSDPEEPGYNTLFVSLGAVPVLSIQLESISVGTVYTGSTLPSGQQYALQVGGIAASSGFTATRLEVGHLILEKSRCKRLELSDIQAHTLIVRGNASDGQSLAPTAAGGASNRMRAIGGGHHQAEAMTHSGGLFDRIAIQATTSGQNGRVDRLVLTNMYTKGGPCQLSRMNVGTLEILLNEIGSGDGFAAKDFTISTSVTASVILMEDNVEVSISEPATS